MYIVLISINLKDMMYPAAETWSNIHSGHVKNKTLRPSLPTVDEDAEVLQLENDKQLQSLHLVNGLEDSEAVVKD